MQPSTIAEVIDDKQRKDDDSPAEFRFFKVNERFGDLAGLTGFEFFNCVEGFHSIRVQSSGFEASPFGLRPLKQGSAQPPARKTAGLIEKQT